MERNSRQRNRRIIWRHPHLLVLVTLAVLASACVTLRDPESSQEYSADVISRLADGSYAEQTFISRRPALNGIQLWLRPISDQEISPTAYLTLQLFHNTEKNKPVFSTRLSPKRLNTEFPLTLTVPVQHGEPNQEYLLVLRPVGFQLDIYGRNEDAYPHGSFYRDGQYLEADQSFRLSYLYDLQAIIADISIVLKNIWLVIPLVLVLWVPGRVLLQFVLGKGRSNSGQTDEIISDLDWGDRTSLSLGLSLSVVSITIVWSTVIGLRWQPVLAWITSLALLIILIWQKRNGWIQLLNRWQKGSPAGNETDPPQDRFEMSRLDWPTALLIGIFLLTCAVRLAMVRDLAAPAWVDSVHHGVIIRKIMDLGMLPKNYLPYMQSEYATYHSGFHAAVAFFMWLSGMQLHSGLLIFSQVLNALCVFPVYLLTNTLTRNKIAALFAALIAGLFTPMPAYYASWGRFTQLAGTLILPVCFVFFARLSDWMEHSYPISPSSFFRQRVIGILVLFSISLAGLALTHYRVLVFLALLLVAYLLINWVGAAARKELSRTAAMQLSVLSISTFLAVLFSLPWWPEVIYSMVYPQAAQTISSLGTRTKLFDDFAWGYLNTALGKHAMVFAGLGWILAIIRRRIFPFTLLVWVFLMFLLANPGAFGLPGIRILNNTSVEIILFMPFAILGGYLFSELIRLIDTHLNKRLGWIFRSSIVVLSILAAAWGAKTLMPILNQGTILIRQADLEALSWIERNLPAEETVVINSFFWGYNLLAGSDGGYWVAPLAGRQTLPPPVLNNLSNPLDFQKAVNSLSRQLNEKSNNPAELKEFMVANHLRYIFIGAKGGILSPKALLDSGFFIPIYQQNGSWVFRLE